MNYANIRNYDIANGEGVRTSLFVSGCTNHCPGCFNPEQQDFGYGEMFTTDTMFKVSKMVNKPFISGLSILGGDPLCQAPHGIDRLMELCRYVKSIDKTVWLWTGFVWEDIMGAAPWWLPYARDDILISDYQRAFLAMCDVVVDGPYVEALADRALKWRGSANQRVIDVKKTLEQSEVILYER